MARMEITAKTHNTMAKKGKLIFVNACVRGDESRTQRIATPIIEKLKERYETTLVHLPSMKMDYLDPETFAQRGKGDIPSWALDISGKIAKADRIVIAAPFWDMSFPAALKIFFENVSLDGITFKNTATTCEGLCKCEKVLYITTRGMDIPDDDPRETALAHLKALSSLWGLGNVTMLSAWNMDYCSESEREKKIEKAIGMGLAIAEDF